MTGPRRITLFLHPALNSGKSHPAASSAPETATGNESMTKDEAKRGRLFADSRIPTESERQQLCEMLHFALLEIRMLGWNGKASQSQSAIVFMERAIQYRFLPRFPESVLGEIPSCIGNGQQVFEYARPDNRKGGIITRGGYRCE